MKKKLSKNRVTYMTTGAMIAAIYVVCCLIVPEISYGVIQFRIAEALCILPFFTPAAIPGLTIGCLLANLLGTGVIMDVIFGTLATLIGAVLSYQLRKHKFLVCLPPIISNTVIIPWVLTYAYGATDGILFLTLTVGLGELIAVGVLGNGLLIALQRFKNVLFQPT